MARESHDREDLLRDATAYSTRIQFIADLGEGPLEIFAGFHRTGAFSFYFDQDPVYHFNRSGQLRRAFADEVLIKAEAGQLVQLSRQRAEGEVALVRQVLSLDEQTEFCASALARLIQLRGSLEHRQFVVEGVVTEADDVDLISRLIDTLDQLAEIRIAASPKVTD